MSTKKHSLETKKKISETLKRKGIKPLKTPEILKKIADANRGRKQSEETKRKLSIAHKGKKHSESWKEKMRGKIPWNKGMIYKIELKGENHPSWKGGKTPLVRMIRNLFEYRQWRSDIFTRDDFTCLNCSERGKNIEAHHLESFSTIIHKNDIKSIEEALNCEELWNINNGITLCNKCHNI